MNKIVLMFFVPFILKSPAFAKKAPSVILSADTLFFSPNKDGLQDEINFIPKVKNIKDDTTWELQFRDSFGTVRKTISGYKNLPAAVPWDGQDDFGALCSEGNYEVAFKIWDEKNQQVFGSSLRIVLDLTPPTISLSSPIESLFIKEGLIPSVTFYFSAVDLSGISDWKLQMLDSKKEEFFSETSTAPLPLSWVLAPERASVPLGNVTAILAVNDRAGNRGTSPPVQLEIQNPTEQKIATPIEKNSVDTYLQLTSIISLSDLFGNDADVHSPLSPQAAILLEPLAKSILESPGSRATILGHVDTRNNAQEEKALSSYFAWRVFSYFVKQKSVDKNALSVKGLGADVPIVDNRTKLGRARNRRIELQIFFPAE